MDHVIKITGTEKCGHNVNHYLFFICELYMHNCKRTIFPSEANHCYATL